MAGRNASKLANCLEIGKRGAVPSRWCAGIVIPPPSGQGSVRAEVTGPSPLRSTWNADVLAMGQRSGCYTAALSCRPACCLIVSTIA